MPTLVVCPLRFERDIVRRTVRVNASVACCGLGAEAVRTWARTQDEHHDAIVLVGTAGALDPTIRAGTARGVTEVIDVDTGRTWTPPLSVASPDCRAVQTHAPVTGAARIDLRAASNAAIVDMESVAFAQAAEAAGWRWGIVRGVSDDADHELPPEVTSFTAENGRTRPLGIALALARRPQLARELIGVRRRAIDAMRAATYLHDTLTA
jgi:nucleoside phosphorylase